MAVLAGLALAGPRASAAAPRAVWARSISAETQGASGISLPAICVDAQGNTIVAGPFRGGTIRFDAQTAVTVAGTNNDWLFLAKYNPAGGLMWAKTGGSTNYGSRAEVGAVTADASGNVYLAANMTGENNLLGVDVTNAAVVGAPWIAVAKLDPNGNVLWLTNAIGDFLGASINHILVNGAGPLTALGGFRGPLTFSPGWTIYSYQNSQGQYQWEGLVVYLSNDGAWTRVTPGDFSAGYQFAAMAGTNIFYGGNNSRDDVYTDCDGYHIDDLYGYCQFGAVGGWQQGYGGVNLGNSCGHLDTSDTLSGMAFDEQGDLYLSGYYYGSLPLSPTLTTNLPVLESGYLVGSSHFLAKFEPVGGTNLWITSLTNDLPLAGGDRRQGLLSYGSFSGTESFGPFHLQSNGGEDVYLLDTDDTGQPRWAFSFGSTNLDTVAPPAIGDDGSIYVAGTFSGPMTIGNLALTNSSSSDIYLIKFAQVQSGRGDWWMARHDRRHTGRSPFGGLTNSPPGLLFGLKWSFTSGGAIESSAALSRDGVLYFGADDFNLYAVDTASGQTNWTFATGADIGCSPAVGTDGTVYFSSWDDKFYAVDPATGSAKWAVAAGAGNSSPAIGTDGTVYYGGWTDHLLYAFNGATGATNWVFQTQGGISSSPAIGYDGTIYVGSDDNNVYAINPDGSQRWVFSTGNHIRSSPAIGRDGTVYVGSWDGHEYALDGQTGAKKWAFAVNGAVNSSAAVGLNGLIYFGSDDHNVYAVDAVTGTNVWTFTGAAAPVFSSPVIAADGSVYAASYDGIVYHLDGRTGAALTGGFTAGGAINASAAIGPDGTLYIGAGDHKMYALGQMDTATSPPTILYPPQSQPVVVGAGVTFAVTAVGALPMHYQWMKDGADIAGANDPTLELTPVTANDAGSYSVELSNAAGVTDSVAATLGINPLTILGAVGILQGFGVTISGAPGVSYTLEASDSLTRPNWTSVTSATGDGGDLLLQDTGTNSTARFYRVRAN